MEESRTNWIPITSELREEVVFKVSVTTLELQDSIWQWGVWTNVEIPNVFKMSEIGKRPYEFPDNVHVSVAIELQSDLTVLNRQVYSVLDWLGDIGGLSEALFFIGATVLMLFTFGSLEIMLVT